VEGLCLNSPRGRREDNIKKDLQVVEWRDINWTELVEDMDRWQELVNTVMNLPGSIQCREFLDYLRNCQILRKDYLDF